MHYDIRLVSWKTLNLWSYECTCRIKNHPESYSAARSAAKQHYHFHKNRNQLVKLH